MALASGEGGACVEQGALRTRAHLLHEGRDRRGHVGEGLAVERASCPCIEEPIDQREREQPVRSQLATAEQEARRDANDVEAPWADDGIVEIVEIELHDALLLRALLAARRGWFGGAERIWPIRADVLEVHVADDPPFAGWSRGEIRPGRQELEEQGRGAAQVSERRGAHTLQLADEELGEPLRPLAVERELSIGEHARIEAVQAGHGGHGLRHVFPCTPPPVPCVPSRRAHLRRPHDRRPLAR